MADRNLVGRRIAAFYFALPLAIGFPLASRAQILAPSGGGAGTANTGALTWTGAVTFTDTTGQSFALPPSSDTLAGLVASQTLTNKTLTSPVLTSPALGAAASGDVSAANVAPTNGNQSRTNAALNSDVYDAANYSTLQAAFTAAAGGGEIFIPCGTYTEGSAITQSLAAGAAVTVRGGGSNCTFINFTSNSGFTQNFGNQFSSVHWRGLTIEAGAAGTGSPAITLAQTTSNANPAVSGSSDFFDVVLQGTTPDATNYWATGVSVQNVSNINFGNLTFTGPSAQGGTAVSLVGLTGSGTYGVVYNFPSVLVTNASVGINYGSYIQGVTVGTGSNFAGVARGIYIPSGISGLPNELNVIGAQFDASVAGIDLETEIGQAEIVGNLFLIPAGADGVKGAGSGVNVHGNSFSGLSTTSTIGLYVTGGGPFTNIGNNYTGLGVGWKVTSSASLVGGGLNTFIGNTTNFSDSGTSDYSLDLIGGSGIRMDSMSGAPTITGGAISGSQINNTPIGGSTQSSGHFSSVQANAFYRMPQLTYSTVSTYDPSPVVGDMLVMTDASACTANSSVPSGGGTTHSCAVVYNGSSWIALVTH